MHNERKLVEDNGSVPLEELVALQSKFAVTVVDVRSAEEFSAGHIAGSVNIPLDRLLSGNASQLVTMTEAVTVCARGGARSHDAAKHLRSMGIEARPLCGGARAWLESQGTFEKGEQK